MSRDQKWAENRIIAALDGMNIREALWLAAALRSFGTTFKVNTLLREIGYPLVQELRPFGPVFADLKLHDIPNTVGNDCKALAKLSMPLRFVTVMAAGGIEMMRAAGEALHPIGTQTLAVTVLTSLSEKQVQRLHDCSTEEAVVRLAHDALEAGMSGIVCSPQELKMLAKYPEFHPLIKVTPGIRPKWYNKGDDQKRVMTPAEAITLGAHYLVVGRPITEAKDPVEAFRRTAEEIEMALTE